MLLPGDGIGPEVTAQAVRVLNTVAAEEGFAFEFAEGAVGGAAIDRYGSPLPDEVLEQCLKADAVFLGAVGGPKWDHLRGDMRPESGLLRLRKSLGVFANLRPVSVQESLADYSPLRSETVRGTDMLVVRELTGGIYFGQPSGRTGEGSSEEAFNTMRYSVPEIERVARVAFNWAKRRHGHVTSVDKANVLVVSQLWRETVTRIQRDEFSDVRLDHMYVDNAAMQLVLNPRQFDVIVTGNLFGDILSDAAATLGGSLGLLPSASVGGKVGLFEPVHGSAPDIAGQDKANPVAAILTAAMLLEELGEARAALFVREAVNTVLDEGYRTADLWREGFGEATTTRMGDLIIQRIGRAVQEIQA
ncbi:MAG TPA: 3-isopropylmalate dehydrogenase [Rhodothermales bacterium]|nr:3-isopropylmalate dehydrogenase [Rhodothermales bacterium]